jgi:hypothetical protein
MTQIVYDAYDAIALSGDAYKITPKGEGGTPVSGVTQEGMPTVQLHFPENMVVEPTFTWLNVKYVTKDGVVYRDFDAQSQYGTSVGTFDASTGLVEFIPTSTTLLVDFKVAPYFVDNYFSEGVVVQTITFRTSLTNVNPASLQIRGQLYSANSVTKNTLGGGTIDVEELALVRNFSVGVDVDTGALVGDADITGDLDGSTGTVVIESGTAGLFIDPGSVRYDAVSESRVPMDSDLLGINPVRLPASGRVPVINQGGTLVIFHEQEQAVTPTAGATVNCGRTDIALFEVRDADGLRLDYNQFTADREAGTIAFADPLVLQTIQGDALTAPYTLVDRIENMRVATDVDITGRVAVSEVPDRTFPAGSKVADAVVHGDTFARTYGEFHQESWNSGSPSWNDDREGDDTTAKYDFVNYPIEIVNLGSVTERWAVRFKSATTVQVIGEKFGVVLDNHSISTDGDISPLNPATGSPYFTMRVDGFGAGWVTNNTIRFNMEGAQGQIWLLRSTQPGAATETKDSIDIEVRGDAN